MKHIMFSDWDHLFRFFKHTRHWKLAKAMRVHRLMHIKWCRINVLGILLLYTETLHISQTYKNNPHGSVVTNVYIITCPLHVNKHMSVTNWRLEWTMIIPTIHHDIKSTFIFSTYYIGNYLVLSVIRSLHGTILVMVYLGCFYTVSKFRILCDMSCGNHGLCVNSQSCPTKINENLISPTDFSWIIMYQFCIVVVCLESWTAVPLISTWYTVHSSDNTRGDVLCRTRARFMKGGIRQLSTMKVINLDQVCVQTAKNKIEKEKKRDNI